MQQKTLKIGRFQPLMPSRTAPITGILTAAIMAFHHILENLVNSHPCITSNTPKTRACSRCTVSVKRIFGTEIHGHEYAASAHLQPCNPTARFSATLRATALQGFAVEGRNRQRRASTLSLNFIFELIVIQRSVATKDLQLLFTSNGRNVQGTTLAIIALPFQRS
jgi:hypothetical protein